MEHFEKLVHYFPTLTSSQLEAYRLLGDLYPQWNEKINVISRRDIDNLYPAHILHSLAIAAMLGELKDGTKIVDLGTGGGFPGIPLAIFYPECQFHLIDRIGKKIRVASEIASAVGLTNVTFQHGDAGEYRDTVDYVVSRAVMALPELVKISARMVQRHPTLTNRYAPGIICLKGGDLKQEIASTPYPVMEIPVVEYFPEECFETKQIIYVGGFAK